MGFGATSVAKDKSVAGLDDSNVPTNEQGVAMRYFAGVSRMAPTWLGPAYNQKSEKVANTSKTTGTPSDFTDHGSTYHYYGDCAGVFCVGVVDVLKEIWYSSRKIWEGDVERGDTDFATVVTKKGTVTLYWGTETQPVDPILAPFNHPAYRGQCYAVFKKLAFGESADSAPQIEFVLERYPNTANLATQANINHDANPIHVILELLTHERFGVGWDPSLIDLDTANTVANQLKYETMGMSPVLDREQDTRSVLSDLFDYQDAYLIPDPGNAGRLKFGLQRPFTGDPTTLPLLGEYEMTEEPNLQIQSWRDAYNEFVINFTDSANDYQSNGRIFIDVANRRIVGDPLPLTLDRGYLTTAASADIYGAYAAQRKGIPTTTASALKVRKEVAATINLGDFVRLTYANYDTTFIMRVMRRKVDADRAQVVEFDLVADGYFSDIELYVADAPPKPDPVLMEPQPPLYVRMLELPAGLLPAGANTSTVWLAPLVARASGLDVRALVYSSEDGTTYDTAAHTRSFAVYGTLAVDVATGLTLETDATGLLINFPGIDGPLDLATTTDRGLRKLKLLVFVEDEIIAYHDVVVVSNTQAWLTGLRRGCYDTVQAAHAAEVPVLIIARRDLRPFTQDEFDAGDSIHFKVATATCLAVLDLSDTPDIVVPLQARATQPLPPINLQVNGTGANPTYQSGADVNFKWWRASWSRYGFWECWEQEYVDDQLGFKLKIQTTAGGAVRSVGLDPDDRTYTYAAADLLADFGGTAPSSFLVKVFSRRRGVRSQLAVQMLVTLAP